ncbi:MAG TPA: AraC family transcriptional regulator [Flavobacterium sp.]|nr:AraC family transcriptional regulator [Flavobacterium sp.]
MFLGIVFFITALLGFLTLTVVITQYKSNRKVNFYLLVLFLIISFRFFFSSVDYLLPFSIDEKTAMIFRSFGCVVFPCVYLYFKNLIDNKKNPSVSELPYFVAPVLFGFTNLFIHHYAAFLHFYFYFLFLAIAFYYLFLSYVELKNKVWFRNSVTIVVEKQKVLIRNWSIFFFIVCCLCMLRLTVSLIFDIYVAGFSHGTSYLWIVAILSWVLFFKVLLTPQVLFSFNEIDNKLKKQSGFELVFDDFWIFSNEVKITNIQDLNLKVSVDEHLMAYVQEIEKMALEHFCFREEAVSLGDFAEKLKIPKSHLIYLFKYHASVNFISFKKIVRIYDAINLIEEGFLESDSLDLLSKKIGFSSKEIFFKSFKEITGVFPEEYNSMIRE